MKLERESVFSHLTLSHKSEPKSFEYDELSLDSNGLKSGKVVKETLNKNDDVDEDQLIYLVNDSKGEEDFAAPFIKPSSEIEPMGNEACFYTDKSAVECEMPELQVCYRECGFASVKDICIDEGVNSRDKILFESSERSLCTFVFHDKDVEKVEVEKEETGIGIVDANGLKLCAVETESKDRVDCDTKDKIGNGISQDNKNFPETVIPMKETEAENPHSMSSENSFQQDQVSSDKADETTQPDSSGSELEAEQSENNNTEEAQEIAAADSVPAEPSNSITAKELPYSSKVEKKRITFNFNPTSEPGPQNDTLESPGTETSSLDDFETIRENKVEDTDDHPQTGISGSVESPEENNNVPCQLQHVTAQTQSSDSGRHRTPPTALFGEESPPGSQFVSGHFQFGESSFSAAGPMSGRINYSGPVPYSGSISLRSDSSTTSTRSFAFPVLPNEWNSSPIRMAKADRRNFRKHRGWKQGILCCRF